MAALSPFTQEFFQNPYPVYRAMREQPRPYWLELPEDSHTGGAWLLTRYPDVKEVLRKAQDTSLDIKRLTPESQRNPFHYMLLYSDPPDHTRLRSLVAAPFTQSAVNGVRDIIMRVVDSLIDDLRERQEVDFVAHFAEPFPVNVISQIIGTPYEDRDQLRHWTAILGLAFDSTISDPNARVLGVNALKEMTQYFKELIRRPRQPQGSILEAIIADTAAARCSPEEAIAQCMLLLLAGHETTLNLLANGLYCLLTNPEELARLRRQPELVDSMVNEVLRFETPFQRATFRVCTASLHINGLEYQVGERLSPVMSAANRDPEQFEHPDVFDITRKPNRHLSFGLGIHRCLGEKLARSEAHIAFNRILQRLPSIELVHEQASWKPRSLFRALVSLPIRLQ
jgi:cytochrome P450